MLLLLLALAVPLVFLLVENLQALAGKMSDGSLTVPPPPEGIENWPVVGEPLSKLWRKAYLNLEYALGELMPHIQAVGTRLVEALAGSGLAILQFLVAVLISGMLLVYSQGGHRLAHALCRRLAGEKGSDLVNLAEATVHGVMRGVIGIAVIQALLAGLGLFVAGVPSPGLLTVVCLFLCLIHIGAIPVMLPAAIYVFATGETLTAVLFLIWAVFVSTIDNVIGPLIMGRGVGIPKIVIFLGAIGGLIVSGIIGLFVGSVILALGYKLLMGWLEISQGEKNGVAVKT
jgi:predicted PurR-regulated permease PerM